MRLVRGAWKILVGVKDALVLVAMLLFFGLLSAALLARPNKARAVGDGALVLRLDGAIVEQPAEQGFNLGGQQQAREYRLRDVVRAIDHAKDDSSVKAVVIYLDGFGGTYPAAAQEVADALMRVRASGKPVLSYATTYMDSAYRLAAASSEVWVGDQGGALFLGPGGSRPYYKGLIDKLGVNMHIYRVGKYKSYVEPYTRAEASPESKEEDKVLYEGLFADWRAAVARMRPKAKLDQLVGTPGAAIAAAGGSLVQADVNAGIVDKIGDRLEFDERVAALVGSPAGKAAGSFKRVDLDDWVEANPLPMTGDAIGVITVAGDIVDGRAGAGTAAGDTIVKLVLDGLAARKLKALVVRVDSPGGSALASEHIRQAIMEAHKQKLPVVISMGSVAASGGYWVATAGDTIFAEPNTITGSIGIFGLFPTFENALKKIGVTSDATRTTPLSGQPDVLGGVTPEVDQVFQAGIERGYRQFIERVSQARHLAPARVDEIGQGRVWIGETAHQIGLVDRFGGLSDAIAEAARRAHLDPAGVHAEYLEKKPTWLESFLRQYNRRKGDDDDSDASGDIFARVAAEQHSMFARAVGDARRLASGASMQARCLECEGYGPSTARPADTAMLTVLLGRLGW